MGTVRDITEKKKNENELRKYQNQLEKLVDEKTKQLEESNEELRAFSYSVSHDLKAPLRSMGGFSQIILNKYSEKIDKKGKDYLNRIQNSSKHMSKLIDAMLNLSRITRKDLQKEKVNLTKIARDISSNLLQSNPNRKVKFSIEKGIMEFGDKKLLRILLFNLFENAWKFTKKIKIAILSLVPKLLIIKNIIL